MSTFASFILRSTPALLAWCAGLVVAFGAMLFTGFARTPGDLGDARLVHYLLEHGYRWLRGDPLHRELWSPPVFYPAENTAGYSDLLLSAVPCYGCWRLLGVGPDTAFQLCHLTVVSLNFWALYLFLRRCPRLPAGPSAIGAFLFAFASPRLIHLVHLQLQVHFYSIVCLYALYRAFEVAPGQPRVSRVPAPVWLLVFAAGVVGQFYASFYLGWFLGVALIVATAWALVLPACRGRLLAVGRAYPLALLGSALVAALPMLWLAQHYLAAARTTSLYPYEAVGQGLPNPAVWLSRGPECWVGVTRGLVGLGVLSENPWPGGESARGIGVVTTVLAGLGLWRQRRRPFVQLLSLMTLTLLACFTVVWFPDAPDKPGKSLYAWVFPLLPGAGAVRAPGRLVLLLLVPAAVGLAYLAARPAPWRAGGVSPPRDSDLDDRPRGAEAPRSPLGWVVLVGLVCWLEQGRTVPTFDKAESRERVEAVARRVPPDALAFFVWRRVSGPQPMLCQTQLDAMWAQLESGVPTVNGYSSTGPPGWDLECNELQPGQDAGPLRAALGAWLRVRGVPAGRVARIEMRDP
jgi:hypothetical protein